MLTRACAMAGGVLLALACAACGSYVRRGSDLYGERRYVEAAEVFERTEARLSESPPREQAEYGLYRGLTMLVLNDLSNAQRWLSFAYEVERQHPGALRIDRRSLLDRGWFELGQRLSSPLTPGTAVAKGSPPAPAQPPPGDPIAPAAGPPDQTGPRRSFVAQ